VLVRLPELHALDLSGSEEASVVGLEGERFVLDVSGSASLLAAGRVDQLDVESSGASELDLSGLVARRARLELGGSSSISVHVEEDLSIASQGSSEVRYRGRPSVRVDPSGSGRIQPID
jgi:hypothetical protein